MKLTPVRVLLACSVSALTIAGVTGLAYAAQPPDVVHATMASGSQTDPHDSYYELQAKPGATITQQIVVANPNDHSVIANVSGVDAWTSDATGAGYGTPGSTPKNTGTWITFVTPQLQLSPSQSRTIPFTVTVPGTALPGQYLAAVSVSIPAASTPPPATSGHKASFDISLQTQRVIAVEIDVPGPRSPHLVVRSVKPVVQANTLRLQFDVANVGNAFAKGHGSLTVPDTNTHRDFNIDTFVSHTSAKLALAWTKDVVPGLHQVTLRLQDQNGRIITWTGSVDVRGAIGAALERTLSAAKGAKLGKSNTSSTRSSGSSLQWLALLLIPICIAAAVHLHRRRGATTAAPSPSGRRHRGFTATPPRDRDPSPAPSESNVETNASR
ncbi:MAG TPA: DUF916 domain-containing protein [Acidimicrobiia bacterium]|jgi:hypothetical protein